MLLLEVYSLQNLYLVKGNMMQYCVKLIFNRL